MSQQSADVSAYERRHRLPADGQLYGVARAGYAAEQEDTGASEPAPVGRLKLHGEVIAAAEDGRAYEVLGVCEPERVHLRDDSSHDDPIANECVACLFAGPDSHVELLDPVRKELAQR